jgi:hypothetical protein
MSDVPIFSDESYLTAQQKNKVLHAWARFLKGGCLKSQFTEDLYNHLTQHCSFIAHFDRHGFYNFYFERITPDLARFFDQFDPRKPGISAEYGMTYWLNDGHTGTDLNREMREAAGPFLDGLRNNFEEIRRQRDISTARSLLAQYGLAIVPAVTPVIAPADSVPRPRSESTATLTQPALFAE